MESRTATRIAFSATLAGGAIGIIFAGFQVQGWHVPKPIALILFVALGLVASGAAAVALYEIARAVKAFLEHRDTSASRVLAEEPGLMDYEPDGIRAQEWLTEQLSGLNADTETLGKRLNRHTARMTKLATASGKRKQRRANKSAKDINRSATYMEKRLALLAAIVDDIYRNVRGLIAVLQLETEIEVSDARTLRDTIASGKETTAETLASVTEYRQTVGDIEEQDLARTIRLASHRLGNALDGVVKVLKKHHDRSGALVEDFDRRLTS